MATPSPQECSKLMPPRPSFVTINDNDLSYHLKQRRLIDYRFLIEWNPDL